ncbi:MAG: DUF4258 domain-containing protein [Candidatus Heimdallarchaeota archaeon]|nr:DUF4258 domain-containing protein [Candidatus Heimdallarchaeota archaeon]
MIERGISTLSIKSLIKNGEIIEQYSDDYPCPSVLLFSTLNDVPVHLVIGNCDDHIRIVTIYEPDEDVWINHRKRRGDSN